MDFLFSFFFFLQEIGIVFGMQYYAIYSAIRLKIGISLFFSSDLYIIFLSMNCISITDDYSAAKEIDKH